MTERPFEVRYVPAGAITIETKSFETLPEAVAFMKTEPNSAVTQNGYGVPDQRVYLPKPPGFYPAASRERGNDV